MDLVKAFATIGVVVIHGKNIYEYADVNADANCIVRFIAFIMSTGVPLFWVASGYLWGVKTRQKRIDAKKEAAKVWRTLLVPYFLVNLICLCFEGALSFVLPTYSEVSSFSAVRIISCLTWEPIYFPFWFIRNLVILQFFSILIERVEPNLTKYTAVLLFLIGWFFPLLMNDYGRVTLIYYGLGVLSGCQSREIDMLIDRIGNSGIFFALLLVFVCPICSFFINSITVVRLLTAILVIAELLLAFIGGRKCKDNKMLLFIGANSFFIYAFHGKLLSALQIVSVKVFPHSVILLFAEYIILPVIVIVVLVIISVMMKKHMPTCYGILTGGR